MLNGLKRDARGTLSSFVLEDGSRHYYDPQSGERFLHAMNCLRAQDEGKPFPEPPASLQALTRARNRAVALEEMCGGSFGMFPYDHQALIERGELVPRSMVAGVELGEPLQDFSEKK